MSRIRTLEAARGRWREILPALGVSPKFLKKVNGPCPACGGKDRFCFNDRTKNGDYYCNQCGAGQGISLVAKVNGWEYKHAASAVDNLIGNRIVGRAEPMSREDQAARAFFDSCPDAPDPWQPERALEQATLWLRRYQPLKLPEWLHRHNILLTIWLDAERPFGYWPDDARYTCEGSLVNICQRG